MKKLLMAAAAVIGTMLFAAPALASDSVTMYRVYNPNSGEHFYTEALAEKNHLVSLGWNDEGTGWTAPEKSNTPVYRLYNPNAGDHHYTIDQNERAHLIKIGWNDEEIGWYSDDKKAVPVYRQYNPNAKAGAHNYTVSKAENDSLVKLGWNAEGIGWFALAAKPSQPAANTDYSLVQNVYNWGSSYSKIILPVKDAGSLKYLDDDHYTVSVERFDRDGKALNSGTRTVTGAYRSDKSGHASETDKYVTLVMGVGASNSLASPYYNLPNGLKAWATCKYTVKNTQTHEKWNKQSEVYHPDEERFKTANYQGTTQNIPYAYYEPQEKASEKHPLIIWFHGYGSGGTDIGFVTGGMKVTNFVTDQTQDIFGGSYVLLPQAKTMWMDAGDGKYSTDGKNIYQNDVKALIKKFAADHPNIDTKRIYVGGCSNGGYMTVSLVLDEPDYYTAAFPVCEAYQNSWITDQQISSIKDVPLWFVHCNNDPTVNIQATAIPTYTRLKNAGAKNLHFTRYDSVTDPEYGNAYTGHFTWVYALLNLCDTDYNGEPVTVNGTNVHLFQWLASQSK